MRLAFGIMFLAIIAALAVCARVAGHSGKRIGSAASILLASLILPMAGNMIIILSSGKVLSLIGCYLYYIGLDVAIAALIHFTFVYCGISWPRKWIAECTHKPAKALSTLPFGHLSGQVLRQHFLYW